MRAETRNQFISYRWKQRLLLFFVLIWWILTDGNRAKSIEMTLWVASGLTKCTKDVLGRSLSRRELLLFSYCRPRWKQNIGSWLTFRVVVLVSPVVSKCATEMDSVSVTCDLLSPRERLDSKNASDRMQRGSLKDLRVMMIDKEQHKMSRLTNSHIRWQVKPFASVLTETLVRKKISRSWTKISKRRDFAPHFFLDFLARRRMGWTKMGGIAKITRRNRPIPLLSRHPLFWITRPKMYDWRKKCTIDW